jgi:hypothetical protein
MQYSNETFSLLQNPVEGTEKRVELERKNDFHTFYLLNSHKGASYSRRARARTAASFACLSTELKHVIRLTKPSVLL